MSVGLHDDVIRLAGACPVEDAEGLLALLHDDSCRSVDLTEASSLHTAVVQVLLCFRPALIGPAGDAFFAKWLTPLLIQDILDTGPA